jgi:hypothetical protein
MDCGSSYLSNWFHRADKTWSEQPRLMTPSATTTPHLEEEVRYDQDCDTSTDMPETITLIIAHGKGFGDLDVQETFGVQGPRNNELGNGRNCVWNNTVPSRAAKKLSGDRVQYHARSGWRARWSDAELYHFRNVAGRFKLTKKRETARAAIR